MIRSNLSRAVFILAGSACAAAGTLAHAAYRDAAPAGVVLAGTAWQLDPYRSDDPKLALKKARDDLEAQRRKAMSERRRRPRGRFPYDDIGLDDPYDADGDAPTDGAGGGDRDGDRAERRGGPHGERGGSRPEGGGRGGASGPGGPAGRERGGPEAPSPLDELDPHPAMLAFSGARRTMRIDADGFGIECEAGNDTMLQDRFGYGSRRCGWDGRAWVVETRHDRGATRIDRYELSRDGRLLTYSTSLALKGTSKVLLSRTYEPAPTQAQPQAQSGT